MLRKEVILEPNEQLLIKEAVELLLIETDDADTWQSCKDFLVSMGWRESDAN